MCSCRNASSSTLREGRTFFKNAIAMTSHWSRLYSREAECQSLVPLAITMTCKVSVSWKTVIFLDPHSQDIRDVCNIETVWSFQCRLGILNSVKQVVPSRRSRSQRLQPVLLPAEPSLGSPTAELSQHTQICSASLHWSGGQLDTPMGRAVETLQQHRSSQPFLQRGSGC